MTTLDKLAHGLVVSIQPVDDGPLDVPEVIALMAKAAQIGGASAIRIEGADNLEVVRKYTDLPIIGIVKRDFDEYPVRITALEEDVKALAEAGADIIAFDGTDRPRPVSREKTYQLIRSYGKLAMADCSNREDGDFCAQLGCDIIGTTLSGYTGGPVPEEPDFDLLDYYVSKGYFVMAEGRFNTPELVAEAISRGAKCATVGTVLTRLEVMTGKFASAAKQAK